MDRRTTLVGSLLGLLVLLLGWLADSALVERRATAEERARAEADETARLGAMTLRAAVAELELSVVAGTVGESVQVERLAMTPSRFPSHGHYIPYSQRPTHELVELLRSDELTPAGLPEPVVAALALDRRRVPNASERKADVASRLLSGSLPVHPADLTELARALGADDEARIETLRVTLENAPDTERMSRFPDFERTLRGDDVDGWSRLESHRMHYQLPLRVLLQSSGVSERVQTTSSTAAARAAVPGFANLTVFVEPVRHESLALGWLRLALWASVGLSGIVLFVVLRAFRREEEALAKEKRFLANVTHELRTPLAAIRVLAESLGRGRGEPAEYGKLIAREAERLGGLTDRVLAVTRLEEALELARVRPRELAGGAVALQGERAKTHSVRLELEHSPNDVPEALWDGDAVRRALDNLIENAIVHGGDGRRVTVSVESVPDGVRFVVADSGRGIRPQETRRVFGRFERGDGTSPGTGLGLYLVERVARAHAGRVELETSPGEGCRFSMTLPLSPPNACTRSDVDEETSA